MKRFRKILSNTQATFSSVSVGQSFTVDGEVWERIKPCRVDGVSVNAVRISAQAEPGNPRFDLFSDFDAVWNVNEYALVHTSRNIS